MIKPQWDLLNKTEMTIEPISLQKANLNDIAATIADVLAMEQNDVFVSDLRENVLTIDILKGCVDAYNIAGKKKELLQRLAELPGVRVTDATSIRSAGMLGWIALDDDEIQQSLKRSEEMAQEIRQKLSKRVIVFSTGAEVANKKIEDTNTPTIKNYFEHEGYKVFQGEVLKDDKLFIAAKLREAAAMGGYSVIITTGGVGAEDKDQTVEAMKEIDPDAATPYICHFKIGTGRHVKNGVKIAVGEYNGTLIISLPGPNDEVKASLEPIVNGLKMSAEKQDLAELIAVNLRSILRKKMQHSDDMVSGCYLSK
jgi:molybdenum cofactor synthesis domain-containing protein